MILQIKGLRFRKVLAIDSILNIMINVTAGLVVNEMIIKQHINDELPFMATGKHTDGSGKSQRRQTGTHEKIRQLSMEAGEE